MTSRSGDQVMSIPVSAGSLLGLPAILGDQPYSLTAMVFKGAQLSLVTRDDFSLLMLNEPSLSLSLLRVLAAEVRSARLAISAH
jgi:CRP-like cAMP-binding protein